MTLQELYRRRRIENLAIVGGLLFLITAAVCNQYAPEPKPTSTFQTVRG